MKYCPTCGEEVREGARFCHNCGVALPTDLKDTDVKETKDEKPIEKTVRTEEDDVTKALGIVIIVAMWMSVAWVFFDVFGSYAFPYPLGISKIVKSISDPLLAIVIGLIPAVWRIPMAYAATMTIRNKKKIEIGFGVMTLLLCSVIAGILIFIYNPEKKPINKK